MRKIALILFSLLYITVAFSQIPSWEKAGRIGYCNTGFECMVTDGAYVYVGAEKSIYSQNGVFRSNSAGSDFSLIGLGDQSVVTMTAVNGQIYAGTADGDIFASADNGSSWVNITAGSPFIYIHSVAKKEQMLLVGAVDGSNIQGLFISYNEGVTWNGPYMKDNMVSDILVWENNIYALINEKLWKSTDGISWLKINIGDEYTDISSFKIFDNIFFAGGREGLYKSEDNGITWTLTGLQTPLLKDIYASGSLIIATGNNLYVSTDAGTSWQIPPTSYDIRYAHALIEINGKLMISNYGGIYSSLDNGTTWTRDMPGFRDCPVISLITSGSDLVAGTYHFGIQISKSNGLTWISSNSGIDGIYYKYSPVSAITKSGTKLIAGTGPYASFISSNNGLSWSQLAYIQFNGNFNELKSPYGSKVFAATEVTLYQSDDNGVNWSDPNVNLMPEKVCSVDATEGKLFVGLSNNRVLFSSDEGLTFSEVPLGPTFDNRITSLLISGNYLFCGDSKGIHRVNLNDYTDIEFDSIGAPVNDLISHNGYILAATYGLGMFVSSDNGAQWVPVNNGLEELHIFQMLVKDGIVYAGTLDGLWQYHIPPNLGINEIADEPIIAYPNPASGFINIEIPGNHTNMSFMIFNSGGKLIDQKSLNQNDRSIRFETNGLRPGIYFYSGGGVTGKFVVR